MTWDAAGKGDDLLSYKGRSPRESQEPYVKSVKETQRLYEIHWAPKHALQSYYRYHVRQTEGSALQYTQVLKY